MRTRERILRIAAPADGDVVAASDNDGHLFLYEPTTLAVRRIQSLPYIDDIAFSPDGSTVYV